MTISVLLLLIGLFAPLLAHVIGIAAYSLMLLFVAITSYPIMVAVALVLLFPLHHLFYRWKLGPISQLPIAVVSGGVGGFVVHLCWSYPQIVTPDTFTSRLAIEYAGLGLLAAVCCWLLYNWGPIHVAGARSNFSSSGRGVSAVR